MMTSSLFANLWRGMVERECMSHSIWQSRFIKALESRDTDKILKFRLASCWAENMLAGSYYFPAYVASLASRASSDTVRHGLLENAWDESGGVHHKSRSHFWLAARLNEVLGTTSYEGGEVVILTPSQNYIAQHLEVCRKGEFELALGMICLIEEFTTREFTTIFNALIDSIEVAGDMPVSRFLLDGGSEYFTANISDDERHREEMPRLVYSKFIEENKDLSSEGKINEALFSIEQGMRLSLELRADFFEKIFEEVLAT